MEKSVNNVLEESNFKFKHKFGQNFLSDTNLLKAIITDAKILQNDNVLEIGAGAGTLTYEIAKSTNGKVVSVEIDTDLKPILEKRLNDCANVQLKFGDILNYSPTEIADWFDGQPFKVVANLPYYISSPIIFFMLESGFKIQSLTIMLQYELAQRLCAKKGSRDYGSVSVLLDLIAQVYITRKVPKTMFVPQPKVDSAVLNIDVDFEKYAVDYSGISPIIKMSFAMKRKTLLNNLSYGLKVDKSVVEGICKDCKIDASIRAEALSTEQFISLYKSVKNRLN